MLYTKTDVFNFALGELGSTLRIVNADTDNTNIANILRRHFDMAVSKVLDLHDWSCYRKTGALTLVEINPSDNWDYKYDLPADGHCIRRINCENYFPLQWKDMFRDIPFEQVDGDPGVYICANIKGAWAEYTAKPGYASSYIAYMAEAFAVQLAMLAAPSVITNNWIKMKDVFLKDGKTKISQCIATDITRQPIENTTHNPFSMARRG